MLDMRLLDVLVKMAWQEWFSAPSFQKTEVPRWGWDRSASRRGASSGVFHVGGIAGLYRPDNLPMGYLSRRESANSGDWGWSPKVGLVLRVSDKSFPLGIGRGVDMARPSNLLVSYKWLEHPECGIISACSPYFGVWQCRGPFHYVYMAGVDVVRPSNLLAGYRWYRSFSS